MRLLFVGDGHRDKAVVPCLTASIRNWDATSVRSNMEFVPWSDLRVHGRGFGQLQGSGYRKKLQLAMRRVAEKNLVGLIATVDCDSAVRNSRLQELKQARMNDRAKNRPFPTAVGEAQPHLEAWLLDDPVAVRLGLGLANDFQIASVTKVSSPKQELDRLIDEHGPGDRASRAELLGKIASSIDPKRHAHAAQTGFEAFVNEVEQEFTSK